MAYTDRAAIAVDETFISRVRVAMMTAAVTLGMQPPQVGESDYMHKMRIRFCTDVIYGNPERYVKAVSWALIWDSSSVPGMVDIVSAAADLTDAGDAQIQQAVNAVFQFMIVNQQ